MSFVQPSGQPPSYSPYGQVTHEQIEVEIQVEERSWKEEGHCGLTLPPPTPRPYGLPEFEWIWVPFENVFTIPQLFALNQHITNTRMIRFEVAVGKRLEYIRCLAPNSAADPDQRPYRLKIERLVLDSARRSWDGQIWLYRLYHQVKDRDRGEWA